MPFQYLRAGLLYIRSRKSWQQPVGRACVQCGDDDPIRPQIGGHGLGRYQQSMTGSHPPPHPHYRHIEMGRPTHLAGGEAVGKTQGIEHDREAGRPEFIES